MCILTQKITHNHIGITEQDPKIPGPPTQPAASAMAALELPCQHQSLTGPGAQIQVHFIHSVIQQMLLLVLPHWSSQ